jgi:hypothetical protein
MKNLPMSLTTAAPEHQEGASQSSTLDLLTRTLLYLHTSTKLKLRVSHQQKDSPLKAEDILISPHLDPITV